MSPQSKPSASTASSERSGVVTDARGQNGRPQPRTVSFWYSGQVPSKTRFRKSGKDWRQRWKRIKDFEEQIGYLAMAAGAKCSEQPVELYVLARKQRGDLDGLLKAVQDGMEGIAFVDDSQRHLIGVHVVRCHREGEAGIEVSVRYTSHDVVREEAG